MLKLLRVQGDSMWPRYRSADYVLVARPLWRQLRVGDDIVSNHPDFGTILKRITAIEHDHLLLTGLNSSSTSTENIGRIPYAAVLGRVILHIRANN